MNRILRKHQINIDETVMYPIIGINVTTIKTRNKIELITIEECPLQPEISSL